jgi:hypothetical protein
MVAYDLPELGLREQQVVVLGASQDAKRRDNPGFGRQEQGIAGCSNVERGNVVRDHAVEKVARVRASDADERAWPASDRDRSGSDPHVP